MRNSKLKILMLLALLWPALTLAALPSIWPTGYWGPLLSCNTARDLNGNITNPCASLCDLIHTFINVVYFGITIALFLAAPISYAVGGVMLIFGGANAGLLSKGKEVLKLTTYGVVIVLVAYILVSTFISVLGLGSSVGGFGSGFGTCKF